MKKLVVIILVLLIVLLSSCTIGQVSPHTVKKMLEKYSDDQNYVALSGEVMEFDENNVIIKCKELNNYISYEDELCDYYIFSDQIMELSRGDQIDFVTVPFHFFNGHRLPIVELKMNGDTLLNINDGKANLMEWVNSLK